MIRKSWIWHLALVMVVAMIIVGERAELGEGCSEVPECFQLLEAWGQTAVEAGMQISGLTSTWPPAFGPLRELLDVRDAHLASLREIAVLLLSSIHHDHYASYPHLPHPHHHSHHSHHSQHSQHDDHQHSHHHHSHTHSSHAEKKFDVGEEVVVLDADVADLAPNFGALLDHNQLHLADGHALEGDVVVPQQDQASSLFGHHHHEESDQVQVLFEGDEEERELDSSSQPPIADPSSIFEQQARRAAAAEEEDEQQEEEEEEVILFPTWESCSMARHWNVGEKALRLSELLYWIERSALAEWQEMTQTDTYLTSAIKAARFLCLAEGEHFVPSYSAPSSASAFAQQHYPAAQYHHHQQGPFDDNAGNDVRFVKIELDNGASMSNITQALAQAIRDAIWSLQQNDPTAELVLDQESLEELAAELLYLQSEEDD